MLKGEIEALQYFARAHQLGRVDALCEYTLQLVDMVNVQKTMLLGAQSEIEVLKARLAALAPQDADNVVQE